MIDFPLNRAVPADAPLAPANVLIVDDVPQNLVAMEALLRSDQVNVLTASSGAQALELLLLHDVAVALLDVHMPDMNGFALAELMRGSPRTAGIPIIFLTASPQDPVHAFQGYDAGAVDFLHKPIEPHVIGGKVKVFVELHRQRQLLALHAQRLEHALSLNETMLAVMTHDLRTPLSVVTLCADAIERMPVSPETRVIGQRIQRSALRMSRMISQLLDFSRIRSGVLHIEPAPTDLAVVAQQVIDEARQAHPGTSIQATSTGNLAGTFDADRIAQVLSNLVANAAQHADDGKVRVGLDGASGGTLSVTVSNRGRIDEALLPRLFEPFKGVLHASSGLGLGLYIVDQFVRAHGGSSSARNHEGEVVMTVRLPRHAPVATSGRAT
ncbi:hybrid sensor histidine kinase/response regulator [Cognatilysobacter segetis]|uniref:hybrid sensor histidine kinase/response regulator n=1 Tax=Cognatilysobacter segetis TaxID=2492394 RepID=UPI00105C43F2|nr:hybrid sensor histidine kinase/response regulator [Lysobacter segetis]